MEDVTDRQNVRRSIDDLVYYWKSRIIRLIPSNARQNRKMMDFYSQFISKGDLCFDIGANLGNRTDIFLKLGADVVAVEPQPEIMRKLRAKHGRNPRVRLVQKAVGAVAGEGRLMVSSQHVLSSLSTEWMNKTKSSGRFGDVSWERSIPVEILTLDSLIEDYGMPVFCKIDVEGYELSALQGLSHPIKYFSIEFAHEFLHGTLECIACFDRMVSKASEHRKMALFNYSMAESMRLELANWATLNEMKAMLDNISDSTAWGDLYGTIIDLDSYRSGQC